jgi:hypothetical protein
MESCKIPELLKIGQLPKSSFLNGCQPVVLAVHLQKSAYKIRPYNVLEKREEILLFNGCVYDSVKYVKK